MLMIMMIIEQLNAADYERWKYSSSHSDGDDHEIDHLVLIIIKMIMIIIFSIFKVLVKTYFLQGAVGRGCFLQVRIQTKKIRKFSERTLTLVKFLTKLDQIMLESSAR